MNKNRCASSIPVSPSGFGLSQQPGPFGQQGLDTSTGRVVTGAAPRRQYPGNATGRSGRGASWNPSPDSNSDSPQTHEAGGASVSSGTQNKRFTYFLPKEHAPQVISFLQKRCVKLAAKQEQEPEKYLAQCQLTKCALKYARDKHLTTEKGGKFEWNASVLQTEYMNHYKPEVPFNHYHPDYRHLTNMVHDVKASLKRSLKRSQSDLPKSHKARSALVPRPSDTESNKCPKDFFLQEHADEMIEKLEERKKSRPLLKGKPEDILKKKKILNFAIDYVIKEKAKGGDAIVWSKFVLATVYNGCHPDDPVHSVHSRSAYFYLARTVDKPKRALENAYPDQYIVYNQHQDAMSAEDFEKLPEEKRKELKTAEKEGEKMFIPSVTSFPAQPIAGRNAEMIGDFPIDGECLPNAPYILQAYGPQAYGDGYVPPAADQTLSYPSQGASAMPPGNSYGFPNPQWDGELFLNNTANPYSYVLQTDMQQAHGVGYWPPAAYQTPSYPSQGKAENIYDPTDPFGACREELASALPPYLYEQPGPNPPLPPAHLANYMTDDPTKPSLPQYGAGASTEEQPMNFPLIQNNTAEDYEAGTFGEQEMGDWLSNAAEASASEAIKRFDEYLASIKTPEFNLWEICRDVDESDQQMASLAQAERFENPDDESGWEGESAQNPVQEETVEGNWLSAL